MNIGKIHTFAGSLTAEPTRATNEQRRGVLEDDLAGSLVFCLDRNSHGGSLAFV